MRLGYIMLHLNHSSLANFNADPDKYVLKMVVDGSEKRICAEEKSIWTWIKANVLCPLFSSTTYKLPSIVDALETDLNDPNCKTFLEKLNAKAISYDRKHATNIGSKVSSLFSSLSGSRLPSQPSYLPTAHNKIDAPQTSLVQKKAQFQQWLEGNINRNDRLGLTPGHVKNIMQNFDRYFTDEADFQTAQANFYAWIDRQVGAHFNPTQAEGLKQGFSNVFTGKAPTITPSNRISTEDSLSKVATRDGIVIFYNHETPLTYCFGNFYESPVTVDGYTFCCSEAAFQAEKFSHDPSIRAQFSRIQAKNPGSAGDEAFKLARAHKTKQRSDWMQTDPSTGMSTNVMAMMKVLRCKFNQNPKLKAYLLATGSAYLIEHTPVKGRDAFWADDCDGSGQNMLGKCLMWLREELGGVGEVPNPYARNPSYSQALTNKVRAQEYRIKS